MAFKDYWGLGVRHIQLLLLTFAALVDALITGSLTAAITMVESELVPSSNFTLYEDAFKATVKAWSEKERNLLSNSIYFTEFCSALVGGYLTLRLNLKNFLLACLIGLSILPYFTPIIANSPNGYWGLLSVRMTQGIFHGPIRPIVCAMFAKWIPFTELSRGLSLIFAGPHLSHFVVILLGKFLRSSVGGWSSLFYIAGNIGVLWCVAWFTFGFPDPQQCYYLSSTERAFITKMTPHVETITRDVQVPWKAILKSGTCNAVFLEAAFNAWVFHEVLQSPRYIIDFVSHIHKVTAEKVMYYVHLMPLLALLEHFIIAIIVDIIVTKETFPVIHIRKTCNTVGSWGAGICLVFMGYVKTGHVVIIFYILAICCKGFRVVGSFLTPFDISPNFVGLIVGISGVWAIVPSATEYFFFEWMVPTDNYEKGWDHFFYIAALSILVGNYIYITLATADVQKFNKVYRKFVDRAPGSIATSSLGSGTS